jgi:hypothetical protein
MVEVVLVTEAVATYNLIVDIIMLGKVIRKYSTMILQEYYFKLKDENQFQA